MQTSQRRKNLELVCEVMLRLMRDVGKVREIKCYGFCAQEGPINSAWEWPVRPEQNGTKLAWIGNRNLLLFKWISLKVYCTKMENNCFPIGSCALLKDVNDYVYMCGLGRVCVCIGMCRWLDWQTGGWFGWFAKPRAGRGLASGHTHVNMPIYTQVHATHHDNTEQQIVNKAPSHSHEYRNGNVCPCVYECTCVCVYTCGYIGESKRECLSPEVNQERGFLRSTEAYRIKGRLLWAKIVIVGLENWPISYESLVDCVSNDRGNKRWSQNRRHKRDIPEWIEVTCVRKAF